MGEIWKERENVGHRNGEVCWGVGRCRGCKKVGGGVEECMGVSVEVVEK